MSKILVINPGSTSTKLAVYNGTELVSETNIKMDEKFALEHYIVMEQAEYRTQLIKEFMDKNGMSIEDFDIIAARGGWVPPCKGGVYAVNQLMLDVLRYAPQGQHASSLGAVIGNNLSEGKIPVIICDSVSTDEMRPLARMTGIPEFKRKPAYHVLNTRYAAKQIAEKQGKKFEECKYIVVHMGGGSSIVAYENGILVDFSNDCITPQRAGKMSFPYNDFVDMCFSGEYTKEQVKKKLMPEGGFFAYTGTQDALDLENRAKAGDELAQTMYALMAYQIKKCIGEMYAALDCEVDGLIITGALARSPLLVNPLSETFSKIMKVEVVPGERELEALAYAAQAVLDGSETAKEYDVLPERFKTAEEFYKFVETQR